MRDLQSHAGSPIEAQLAIALERRIAAGPESVGFGLSVAAPMEYDEGCPKVPDGSFIAPQVTVNWMTQHGEGRYRVDFLLVVGPRAGYRRAFAIECDGQEWHAKSPEQVARDKLRDRRLLLAGIPTVRFTGSEIHADADACADLVLTLGYRTNADILAEAFTADALDAFAPPRGFQFKGASCRPA